MKISIVAPFYNEEEAISDFVKNAEQFTKNCSGWEWEFVFVDDGSTDKTAEIIRSSQIPNLNIISTEHLGLSHALFTGIKEATGDIIITIDADGQFSFDEIPRFIESLKENSADIVVGYRVKRSDNPIRIISSKVANIIKRIILKDNIRDSTCTLKAFKKEIKDKILYRFDGFHRFIPSFALMNNLKLIQIPIEHRDRVAGKAKFGILNRLPDVIPDVFGVKWLQYKRFSPEADERRYSFYPDLFFLILFLYIAAGLFKGYFRVVDDFWLYSSLNRFIGYDYSKSYGWDIFDSVIPPLIKLIYFILSKIGLIFDIKYPLEWSNKVIGVLILLLTYTITTKYFNHIYKKHLAKWTALLIILYGTTYAELYSGFARSFSYLLIIFLLISFERKSLKLMSITTLLTALLYPVILPVCFVSITMFCIIDSPRTFYRALIPISSGLLGIIPMLVKIDITGFSSPDVINEALSNNTFKFPLSANVNLLMGSFIKNDITEWINFNILHQWILSDEIKSLIKITLTIVILLSIASRIFIQRRYIISLASFFVVTIFLVTGYFRKEYLDESYIFKWGILISAIYILLGYIEFSFVKRYKSLSILFLSSLIAFIITHLLSHKFGFGVHEPGRQLQRVFSILLPLSASILFYTAYKNAGSFIKSVTIISMALIGILFFPSLKLVSPNDKYIIERIQGLPKGSTVLSHPLTANWVVSHTDKYSTIIDEQVRAGEKNPFKTSTEKVLPVDMVRYILGIYYSNDIYPSINWCRENKNAFILVEEYYYSENFFSLQRDPYYSFVKNNNSEYNFALLSVPLPLRHYITPEAYLISCDELINR